MNTPVNSIIEVTKQTPFNLCWTWNETKPHEPSFMAENGGAEDRWIFTVSVVFIWFLLQSLMHGWIVSFECETARVLSVRQHQYKWLSSPAKNFMGQEIVPYILSSQFTILGHPGRMATHAMELTGLRGPDHFPASLQNWVLQGFYSAVWQAGIFTHSVSWSFVT